MEVGDKLNPQRSHRKGFSLKGLHQHIIKKNNLSTIGPMPPPQMLLAFLKRHLVRP